LLTFCANWTVMVPAAFTTIVPSIVILAAATAVTSPNFVANAVTRVVPGAARVPPFFTSASAIIDVAVAVPPIATWTPPDVPDVVTRTARNP